MASDSFGLEKTLAADSAPSASGWIDAHVHVWTPDTQRYPLAEGFTVSDMKPPSFTPEQLLAHAQPVGVSRIVLIQMSFYRFDNSYMLDTIARFPGVFSGVAVIDPTARDVRERMLKLKSQGVRGFRLDVRSADPAQYFDRPAIHAMWKIGAAERLAMGLLINPNSLATIDKMCAQHRDTPVVIDHFARIGVGGTLPDAEIAQLCALAKHPQVTVKVSAFYALGKKQMPYDDLKPMIARLLDAFGPERLMWATDCPYQVDPGHTYASSIEFA